MRIDSPNLVGSTVITGSAVVTGSVVPGSDLLYDFGSTLKRWGNIYAVNLSGSFTGSNVSVGQVIVAGIGGVLSGTNNLFWDNTSTRLGIGTSSLTSTLTVSGSATATIPVLTLRQGAVTPGAASLDVQNRLGVSTFWVSGSGASFFSGSVGIGTSVFSAALFVSGGTAPSNSTLVVREGVTNALGGAEVLDVQRSSGSSLFWVSGSGTSYFSGTVGVGITQPAGPLHVMGQSGSLLLITDVMSGSLFSVNDVAGLPLFEVFSDDRIIAGEFGRNTLYITGSRITVGTTPTPARLFVSGTSVTTDPTLVVKGGVLTQTGTLLEVQNSLSSPLMWVSGSGNVFFSGSVGIGASQPAGKLDVSGVSGSLLLITDTMSGSLFSVNNVSGLPIFEVFSDNTVVAGGYGTNSLVVTGSNVGIGATTPAGKLDVTGVSGSLLLVTDVMSGSLFSVNNVSGLPIFEVFSDDTLIAGGYNTNALVVSGSRVGIGSFATADRLSVSGSMSVTGSLEPGVSNAHALGSSTKLWSTVFATAFSGSLTKLSNGSDYLVAGPNITLTTGSNGAITITGTSAGTVAGTGTSGMVARWTASTTLGTGVLYDTGTNVGIGTASPGERLEVAGVIKAVSSTFGIVSTLSNGSVSLREAAGSSANNIVEAHIRPSSGKSGYVSFTEDQVADRWSIGIQNGNSSLRFLSGYPTTGTERMTLTSGGNLGIGITNPGYKFTIAGTGGVIATDNNASFVAKNTSGTYESWVYPRQSDGLMYIDYAASGLRVRNSTGAVTTLAADNSGNVGLGTATPSQKLHVYNGYAYFENGYGIKSGGEILLEGNGTNTNIKITTLSAAGTYPNAKVLYVTNPSSELLTVLNSGNIGIGVTNPGYKLQVSDGGQIAVGIGTATAPSTRGTFVAGDKLILQTDVNNKRVIGNNNTGYGIYFQNDTVDNDGFTFIEGNSAITNVTRIKQGKVGIGTSTPADQLTVATGNVQVPRSSYVGSSASGAAIVIGTSGGSHIGFPQVGSNDEISFVTHTSGVSHAERMRINAAGNVGIGTTNPSFTLQLGSNTTGVSTATPLAISLGSTLSNAAGSNAKLRLYHDGTHTYGIGISSNQIDYIITDNAGSHVWYTNGSEKVRITNGGNVGIGTNNPAFRLQLGSNTGASTSSPETINMGGTYSSTAGSNIKLRLYNDATNATGISVSANQLEYIGHTGVSHVWFSGGAEIARITSGGKVGIGHTNPYAPLHVKSLISNAYGESIVIDPGAATPTYGTIAFRLEGAQGSNYTGTWIFGKAASNTASGEAFVFGKHGLTGGSLYSDPTLTSVIKTNGDTVFGFNVGIGTTIASDRLTVNGTVAVTGSILPGQDVTYALGSETKRWQHIYTGDLHLKNERGDWTIIEEEDCLTMRNNKTGKRYKINMTPMPELDEPLGSFSTGPKPTS